ncbi:hypothetical protein BDQ17DRAFT_1261665, partial [Cyathus striatus]
LAAGHCFRCREPGHLSRNCPQGSTIRSSGNRPPGISNFNIEMDVSSPDTENLCSNMDDVEVLSSLPFMMVCYADDDIIYTPFPVELDWEDFDPQRSPRSHIGDCYAMVAETILNQSQPYPGDDSLSIIESTCRFIVTRISHAMYLIYDTVSYWEIEITSSLLQNAKFRLAEWFAKHHAQEL